MNPLISVTRAQFIARLQEARQQPFSILPPWMQAGGSGGSSWPFPLFWSNAETLLNIGQWGWDNVLGPLNDMPVGLVNWWDGLKTWLSGRSEAPESDEEFADLIEQWADEAEFFDNLWAES